MDALSALKEIAVVEGKVNITNGTLYFEDGTTLDLVSIIEKAEDRPIYIVLRDSAEGPEVDCFTDRALAEEWAAYCDGEFRGEPIIGADELAAMKESYDDDHKEDAE